MIPPRVMALLGESMENLFREEFRQLLNEKSQALLSLAVSNAMSIVFWIVFGATALCLVCTVLLRYLTPTGKELV